MAAVWILLIAAVTYVVTISLVVLAQEIHVLLSIVLFAAVCFGAFKLFQARLTKL